MLLDKITSTSERNFLERLSYSQIYNDDFETVQHVSKHICKNSVLIISLYLFLKRV
jgi:hypothetical protein